MEQEGEMISWVLSSASHSSIKVPTWVSHAALCDEIWGSFQSSITLMCAGITAGSWHCSGMDGVSALSALLQSITACAGTLWQVTREVLEEGTRQPLKKKRILIQNSPHVLLSQSLGPACSWSRALKAQRGELSPLRDHLRNLVFLLSPILSVPSSCHLFCPSCASH